MCHRLLTHRRSRVGAVVVNPGGAASKFRQKGLRSSGVLDIRLWWGEKGSPTTSEHGFRSTWIFVEAWYLFADWLKGTKIRETNHVRGSPL